MRSSELETSCSHPINDDRKPQQLMKKTMHARPSRINYRGYDEPWLTLEHKRLGILFGKETSVLNSRSRKFYTMVVMRNVPR